MMDWMDEAVRRTKDKFGAQQGDDEKFVLEEGLKHDLGLQFYRNLREWLLKAEKDFNSKYGSNVLVVTEPGQQTIVKSVLTRSESRTAEISYNETLQQIGWVTETGVTHRSIQLKLSGNREMLATADNQDLTVEQLGQKIIDVVLA
jgi:hypothetical protein